MWRLLLALAHPDRGGSHELFLWARGVREYVAGDALDPPLHERPRRTTTAADARVPFDADADHDRLTGRALGLAGAVPGAYAYLLRLLSDCRASHHGRLLAEQRRGASYKQLAAIGHAAGMDVAARAAWYRVAEDVPLSYRMAAHILDKLKGEG